MSSSSYDEMRNSTLFHDQLIPLHIPILKFEKHENSSHLSHDLSHNLSSSHNLPSQDQPSSQNEEERFVIKIFSSNFLLVALTSEMRW